MSQLFVYGLFDAVTAGFVPPSGGGTGTFLRADGAWAAASGGGAAVADGDYGDVTVSGTGTVWTVDSLPESRIANLVADLTALAAGIAAAVPLTRTLTTDGLVLIDGGTSASLAANRALSIATTALTAALDLFSSTLQGLVPASGGGTANFLRADGAWAAPTAGAAPFYDTVLNPATITFGPSFDNWNAGTLGQNTLIRCTTDGIPPGSTSRSVRGLAGGSLGKIVTLLNVNTPSSAISFEHEDASALAANRFHNAASIAATGSSNGSVTYYYDSDGFWRQIGST